jgi:nitroimidazol reductase NimA-like FMN-containing flavoprotein (pyridoxamine 5'-phosphate oxidase superfamily)
MEPNVEVSRLREKQIRDRAQLDALLDSTPLVTIAFIRDDHPVALPIGFARIGDELVIHGSTGSPWLRELASGARASASVTTLDGIVLARSGFESSFRYRSAVLFGSFTAVDTAAKDRYLTAVLDSFIPGRSAELRGSTAKELAATIVLALPIGVDNWSLKVSGGWPDDTAEDIAAGGWAGVVPVAMTYGAPLRAPDCDPAIPVPPSVQAMGGAVTNGRGRDVGRP